MPTKTQLSYRSKPSAAADTRSKAFIWLLGKVASISYRLAKIALRVTYDLVKYQLNGSGKRTLTLPKNTHSKGAI